MEDTPTFSELMRSPDLAKLLKHAGVKPPGDYPLRGMDVPEGATRMQDLLDMARRLDKPFVPMLAGAAAAPLAAGVLDRKRRKEGEKPPGGLLY